MRRPESWWQNGLPGVKILSSGLALALTPQASAQSLEPRAYSPSPIGVSFAVLGLAESTGPVVLDPSLPISDVYAKVFASALGYGHTFSLGGRQALITTVIPYVWGNLEGKLAEQATRVDRSGLGDLQTKLSVNLIGSPALSPRAFAKESPRFILGTSLTVVAPTGQNMPTKLINIGANRWAFKPEVGVSMPWNQFLFDLYGGVWFYTNNTSFYPGEATKRQNPLTSFQAHVSYTFRPRLWVAFNSTWYGGGAASVNEGPWKDRIDSSRAGATLSLPLGPAQSLKFSYSTGVTARVGQKFETFGVGYQVLWF